MHNYTDLEATCMNIIMAPTITYILLMHLDPLPPPANVTLDQVLFRNARFNLPDSATFYFSWNNSIEIPTDCLSWTLLNRYEVHFDCGTVCGGYDWIWQSTFTRDHTSVQITCHTSEKLSTFGDITCYFDFRSTVCRNNTRLGDSIIIKLKGISEA